ncbi:hypothetical protein NKI56_33480 [Mesorhizobium sp. M0622]|uniref:hypothetical protein n=1 Tax=Mesorhizobium sp. M0622 TaxID=2956975 RepID=UPI0033385207
MSARPLKPLSIQLDDTGLDDEARLEGGEAVTRRKLAADAGAAPDPVPWKVPLPRLSQPQARLADGSDRGISGRG